MPQLSLHAPLFDLTLFEEDGMILAADWGWSFGRAHTDLLSAAKAQLDAYFDGETIDFDLPIGLPSHDPEMSQILRQVIPISYSKTITYDDLSDSTGIAKRTVEEKLLENPLPILVPCHRVVRSNKNPHNIDLGSYCGGDEGDIKRSLLILEGAIAI